MPSDRALNIALLVHSTNPRGGVVHALELGDALCAAGHRVSIHAPDAQGRGLFRQTRCEPVLFPAQPSGGSLAEFIERRIDDYLAHFARNGTGGWDILHAQDAISANALATLREAGGVPDFVRTVHHLDTFADPRVMAWQKRGFLSASKVLCVSRLWKDVLARVHGIEADLVTNGVDAARYHELPGAGDDALRARLGLTDAGPVILAVGGIEERKNTLRLLQGFVEVRRAMPAAQLVIAGGVSLLDHETYRARFNAALGASGLSSGPGQAVLVTGEIADEDMPGLFRCADVLAFPSVKEGFGLVILEAMASGTPAVVSRISPFTEYLADGDCVWTDPHEPRAIAASILSACDPETAARLRIAGHRVCERFTWAASARRHLEIYAGLLKGAGDFRPYPEPVHA